MAPTGAPSGVLVAAFAAAFAAVFVEAFAAAPPAALGAARIACSASPSQAASAVAGCPPEIMGIGPVAATQKALKRAGLAIGDIDVIELNEAFAVQALACMDDLKIDWAKTNIDGGATAISHPLGATGARITGKAAQILKREGKKFALSSQCIGGGQGITTILEAV